MGMALQLRSSSGAISRDLQGHSSVLSRSLNLRTNKPLGMLPGAFALPVFLALPVSIALPTSIVLSVSRALSEPYA